MSGAAGRDLQRRSKAGFITAAALFYLSSAVETEAEPAADDQTTTEQTPAPSPQQTTPAPSAQSPSDAPATGEQKSERLPTVSVQANRARAPSTVRATPAVATPVAGPPPSTGEASGQSSNANPPLGATPYQV